MVPVAGSGRREMGKLRPNSTLYEDAGPLLLDAVRVAVEGSRYKTRMFVQYLRLTRTVIFSLFLYLLSHPHYHSLATSLMAVIRGFHKNDTHGYISLPIAPSCLYHVSFYLPQLGMNSLLLPAPALCTSYMQNMNRLNQVNNKSQLVV